MECERRGLRADDRDRRREDCEAISTARCELIAASHFASRADHGEPITASQRSRWRQPARLTPCRSGAMQPCMHGTRQRSARFQNQVFFLFAAGPETAPIGCFRESITLPAF